VTYQVFFVEDEIVTREGIRDNVDWQAHGFQLCGEAPDGEIALPLLQAARPDVLITDIKMPFMDGLQLCKIVRERLPRTKIVILSGHDEFEYAQQAIQLGVTEYLLKPVTVHHLHQVLERLGAQLDRERREQAALERLHQQVAESRAALVERLWFKLLVGAISAAEAVEQSDVLGLDLIARWYLVVVIRIVPRTQRPARPSEPFEYADYQRVQDIVAGVVGPDPDVSVLRKDLEAELVLIIKGNTPHYLLEARDVLLEQLQARVRHTTCQLKIGLGAPRERITDIGQSFIEALADVERDGRDEQAEPAAAGEHASEWLQVDRSALEDYLKCGVQEEIDDFFQGFILPLSTTRPSSIIREYVLLDLLFTTARLIQSWGGEPEQVLPELSQLEAALAHSGSVEAIREYAQPILHRALAFRDTQASAQHTGVIQQARDYIDHHYMDPDISLQAVASRVGHSPSHFCTVFSEATGRTFKSYLTGLRIQRARELLRTTSLRTADISDQVGYNDPHYFSLVFRKATGLSPREFRQQAQRPSLAR
jgi:two-component system response regulator YesN